MYTFKDSGCEVDDGDTKKHLRTSKCTRIDQTKYDVVHDIISEELSILQLTRGNCYR